MSGKRINGVLGPIDSRDLGYTLIHEHAVTCCDWSMRMSLGSQYFEAERVLEMAVKQLKKAKASGITTIVDGSPINLGRDLGMITEAARLSGVNVIASTGFYHQENPVLDMKPERELYEYLAYECTYGMEDSEVLPGIMKCAVDYRGFTPFVDKMLRVCADAARDARLPIFCHTIPELRQGCDMMDVFDACGVPPDTVICGHSGDTDELDYLEAVLRRGCYLGMDRFGIVTSTPGTTLERRVDTVYQLCRRGWAERLLISHDYVPYSGFFPPWSEAKRPEHTDGPVDFAYFENAAVPMLLEKGLSQDDIDMLTIENPRRFFENAYA